MFPVLIELVRRKWHAQKGKKDIYRCIRAVHKLHNNSSNVFMGGKVEFTLAELQQKYFTEYPINSH